MGKMKIAYSNITSGLISSKYTITHNFKTMSYCAVDLSLADEKDIIPVDNF